MKPSRCDMNGKLDDHYWELLTPLAPFTIRMLFSIYLLYAISGFKPRPTTKNRVSNYVDQYILQPVKVCVKWCILLTECVKVHFFCFQCSFFQILFELPETQINTDNFLLWLQCLTFACLEKHTAYNSLSL